ncbi:MAG: hypothetical protein ACMUJM_16735 [bacterium]
MPESKWIFDTVVLSNFLLSDSIFILEKRYHKRGIITWEVFDELSAGIFEYPKLKIIQKLIDKKTFNPNFAIGLKITRKKKIHG